MEKLNLWKKGNRKRASYQLVAEWADDTWKKIATDELIERVSSMWLY